MSRSSRAHRIRKLKKIAARDGGWWMQFDPCHGHAVKYARCYLCGREGRLDELTIDHKTPMWKFRRWGLIGGNAICNLGLAHEFCNRKKAESENPNYGVSQKNGNRPKSFFKRLRKAYRRLRYKLLHSHTNLWYGLLLPQKISNAPKEIPAERKSIAEIAVGVKGNNGNEPISASLPHTLRYPESVRGEHIQAKLIHMASIEEPGVSAPPSAQNSPIIKKWKN